MAIKSMQVLKVATSHVDEGMVNPNIPPGTIIDIFFLCFLIKADEGNILIDTGYHADDAKDDAENTKAQIEFTPLPQCLQAIGFSVNDINLVIMTHLDSDHSGYTNLFTRSEIIIQKAEFEYVNNPPPEARRFIKHERFNSPKLKWKMVDGDEVIIPGLSVIATGGHTPGSQTIMVNLPKSGLVMLVGDALHDKSELEENKARLAYDDKQATNSIKKLKVLSQMTGAPMFPYHVPPIYPTKELNIFRSEMFITEPYI